MSYTPGPWVQEGKFGQTVSRYWADGENDLGGSALICHVANPGGDRAANARLIAAAPEMAALLQELSWEFFYPEWTERFDAVL